MRPDSIDFLIRRIVLADLGSYQISGRLLSCRQDEKSMSMYVSRGERGQRRAAKLLGNVEAARKRARTAMYDRNEYDKPLS